MPRASSGITSRPGTASPTRWDLERADDDDSPPVALRIEERVRDRDRHLVPHLRRPDRVGEDQESVTARILIGNVRRIGPRG